MRILLVVEELGYRGTPRTVANLATILSPRHDVLIWGWRQGGPLVERLEKKGFKVLVGKDAIGTALLFKPDVVNFHRDGWGYPQETEILKQFREQGAKCIETNVFGRVDPHSAKLFDVSIQISLWDLYRWNAWKGGLNLPGVYCPYPVDINEFKRSPENEIRQMRRSWGLDDGQIAPFVLGRIGKTTWSYVEDSLLVALDTYPNLHVVSVDDYGGKGMPVRLRGHPRVHICDKMLDSTELSRFYSACDACLNMNQTGESFGFVNAESMACGTPVIALSNPLHDNAQMEMLGHGKGGVLISDPCELPSALRMCIEDRAFYQNLKAHARGLIVDRYSFQEVEHIYEKLFECLQKDDVRQAISGAARSGELVLDVPRREILTMLQASVGKISFWKLLAMRLLHTPLGYRLIRLAAKCRKVLR